MAEHLVLSVVDNSRISNTNYRLRHHHLTKQKLQPTYSPTYNKMEIKL